MPGILTQADAAGLIPTIVAANFLHALKNYITFPTIILREIERETEIAQYGSTVNVGIAPTGSTVQNLVDGDSVVQQTNAPSFAQVVLNRHQVAAFNQTDIAKMLARPDLDDMQVSAKVAALADAVDSDIATRWADFTATFQGAYGSALSEDTIQAAVTEIAITRRAAGRPLYGVLSGLSGEDLKKIARFTQMNTVGPSQGGNAIQDGMLAGGGGRNAPVFRLGNIGGVMWYITQSVEVTAGAPDQHHNVVFASEGILGAFRSMPIAMPGTGVLQTNMVMDSIPIRVSMQYAAPTLSQLVVVDCLYGTAVGRATFGLELRR